jgi:hypothetical protein
MSIVLCHPGEKGAKGTASVHKTNKEVSLPMILSMPSVWLVSVFNSLYSTKIRLSNTALRENQTT